MKKIHCLTLVSAVLLTPFVVHAEKVVAAINYNPARMGVFDYLRVKDEANIKSLSNIERLDLNGKFQLFNGKNSMVLIDNLKGSATVSGSGATFSGRADRDNTYTASAGDYSLGTNPLNLKLSGGTLEVDPAVMGSGKADSFIKTLTGDSSYMKYVRINAKNMYATGLVKVAGSFNRREIQGFSTHIHGVDLGGLDIVPFNKKKYKLAWGEVTVGDPDTPGGKVTAKVLVATKNPGSDEGVTCNERHSFCPDQTTPEYDCRKDDDAISTTDPNRRWVFRGQCPAKKTYLSYAKRCQELFYDEENGFLDGTPKGYYGRLTDLCDLTDGVGEKTYFQALSELGISDLTPAVGSGWSPSCSPGQPCDYTGLYGCEVGKAYALKGTVRCGWTDRTKTRRVLSVPVYECIESTVPPAPTGITCGDL